MHTELLGLASELARRDEPFVLAVVVARQAPSSAQTGDMALITMSGECHGWLGGSCTSESVLREARRAMRDGAPRLLVLAPDGAIERRAGVTVQPMTCASGGRVEIYLQPVIPATRLAIFGSSPVARALAQIGAAAGYSVMAEGRANGAPHASATTTCHAVVATMGECDEESIIAALALRPAYLGVVASGKRFAQIRSTLLAQGVATATLDTIHSPAGLDIGARRPEEIAVSILAEIVQHQARAGEIVQHQARAGEVESSPESAVGGLEPSPEPAASVVDPICGMTVDPATARFQAVHDGRTYSFCCGGCRARFMAEPERYA